MSSRRRDRRAAAHALRPDSFQPRLGRIPIQGGRFHDNCMRATLPGVSLPCNHVSSRIPQRRFYAKGHALISVASLQLPIRKVFNLAIAARKSEITNSPPPLWQAEPYNVADAYDL